MMRAGKRRAPRSFDEKVADLAGSHKKVDRKHRWQIPPTTLSWGFESSERLSPTYGELSIAHPDRSSPGANLSHLPDAPTD